jgi:hypothetical protein
MRTSAAKSSEIMAKEVWFDPDMMHVRLLDGRIISVPLGWLPRLRDALPGQRDNWRFIGGGVGIHWPDIDEDISVSALMK